MAPRPVRQDCIENHAGTPLSADRPLGVGFARAGRDPAHEEIGRSELQIDAQDPRMSPNMAEARARWDVAHCLEIARVSSTSDPTLSTTSRSGIVEHMFNEGVG